MKRSSIHALNLALELKPHASMPLLLWKISQLREKTEAALNSLHFVHTARFLPTRNGSHLYVITEYDGELRPYVLDFAASISDVFNTILENVLHAEHVIPVQDHPERFYDFVRTNDRVTLHGIPLCDPWPLYSAYGERTVIEIQGARVGLGPPFPVAVSTPIDLTDVQGNILRGYHASRAMHLSVEVTDAVSARRLLATLVGQGTSSGLRITDATEWAAGKPPYALNVGFTAAGMKALDVPRDVLTTFPRVFLEGPADHARAENNGDTGESAPRHWRLGGPGEASHLLFSLYGFAEPRDGYATALADLEAELKRHGLAIRGRYPAHALPNDEVFFGYRDSIAQPHIKGIPTKAGDDMQPETNVGDFLLGAQYTNVYGGKSLCELPTTIGTNGTFCAVRLLAQDVREFEAFLDTESLRLSIDRELLAAKVMGRWRNGDPLLDEIIRSPTAVHTVARRELNKFDFGPTPAYPNTPDDHSGRICPVGSHIRRMNPRSGLVVGKQYSHRVIRRGMPYAVSLPSEVSVDAPDSSEMREELGLFGMFIGCDLERQFEFLMQTWANHDASALGVRGTQDPIIGDQSAGGAFNLPRARAKCPPPCIPADSTLVANAKRFVCTRGSLYLFVPGIAAIRNIATLPRVEADVVGLSHVEWNDIAEQNLRSPTILNSAAPFDPRDPQFLADPYPFYRRLRETSPVLWVDKYRSYWVFTHELVTAVSEDTARFLKTKPGTTAEQGLFFMDPPRHDSVRPTLDDRFARSIAGSDLGIGRLVVELQ